MLQSVYIKVLEGRARCDGRSSFRTWLFGVIRLTALEGRRQRWLHTALLERWHRAEPTELGAGVVYGADLAGERNLQLGAALEQLSRRQREVLHLVFYQDFTIEAAAQALGVSLGSTRTHFERGKRRLRALLQGD